MEALAGFKMITRLTYQTKGHNDILNLTEALETTVSASKVKSGVVLIFAPGTTCGLTMIEDEPGARKDLKDLLEKLAPTNRDYAHHQTWHDGNGAAHLRSALIKPSLTLPVEDGQMTLGTWQQVVLIDFDNKPRQREIIIKIIKD